MSLHAVVSTGRGGAGNMIRGDNNHGGSNIDAANAANEVIMTQDEWDKYNHSQSEDVNRIKKVLSHNAHHKRTQQQGQQDTPTIDEKRMYHHDDKGRIIASSGRGGAGNINVYDKLPSSPRIKPEQEEMELSPVFSTGRGGAGNIYKTKSKTKTKINLETELTGQLSPLHSNKSSKSASSAKAHGGISHGQGQGQEDGKFMKKLKKFFK